MAFAVMIGVSLLTRYRISPAAVDRVMLRMHLPEEVTGAGQPRPPGTPATPVVPGQPTAPEDRFTAADDPPDLPR